MSTSLSQTLIPSHIRCTTKAERFVRSVNNRFLIQGVTRYSPLLDPFKEGRRIMYRCIYKLLLFFALTVLPEILLTRFFEFRYTLGTASMDSRVNPWFIHHPASIGFWRLSLLIVSYTKLLQGMKVFAFYVISYPPSFPPTHTPGNNPSSRNGTADGW